MKPWHGASMVAAMALLAVATVDSCSTTSLPIVPPLEIPGAHYVGNSVCAQCHADIVHEFSTNPHARLMLAKAGVAGSVGCELCHGPGSKHVQAGGDTQLIINPGTQPDACFRCHLPIRAQFELPYHHPVIAGRMSCVDCHDPHGGDIFKPPASGLAMARANESCARCHRAETRPFTFEHPAVQEGCTVCHNPHGSVNRMLLKVADDNLCLRCHAQIQAASGQIYIGNVDHTALLQIGTCWSCHTAITSAGSPLSSMRIAVAWRNRWGEMGR